MFRRKEDSLFDTDTVDTLEADEAITILPSATTASSSNSSGSTSGSTGSASTNSSANNSGGAAGGVSAFGQSPARPAPERTAAPTANAFRPAPSTLGSDLTRNRMPDAKPAQAAPSAPAAASERPAKPSGRRVLTVGNDILLKGEIATCDRLVIEGKVDATLNEVHTVEIAETGSFKGSAHIEDAEISGLFEGDLIVRNRLVIYATGKVRGNISYGEIEIERGGELTGEIKATSQSGSAKTSRKEEKVAA